MTMIGRVDLPAGGESVTGPGGAAADAERIALVERARLAWRNRLIDLSRRNNLLYFRHLRAGTLDLSGVDAERLAPLFRTARAGQEPAAVPVARLFEGDQLPSATARLQEIRRRAQINLEERGLETLHMVAGFATWQVDDEGRPPQAPVLLVPVRVEAAGRDGRTLSLRRAGDAVPNLVLAHALAHGFSVSLPVSELIDLAEGEEDETAALDVEAVFARVQRAAAQVPGFGIASGMAIGNFAFQKLAMVTELDALGEALAAHDLIAAIAGAGSARARVAGTRLEIAGAALDAIPPDEEFLVSDADSTQQRAIRLALGGASGIISGPPGTGKSQTIVNMVAELAAGGRRVLFVAEKRAALDVVLARLERLGLGHLCLDLHGAEVTRRDVAQRVGDALLMIRGATRVDPSACHADFTARRVRLNEHVRLLHEKHHPWEVTLYELQGDLLAADPAVRSAVRWRQDALRAITPPVVARVKDLFFELAGVSDLFLGTNPSPWAAAQLDEGRRAQDALDEARELLDLHWPAFVQAAAAVCQGLGVRGVRSLDDGAAVAETAREAGAVLGQYDAALFSLDLPRLLGRLTPAAGVVTRIWAFVTDGDYRRAVAEARSNRREQAAPAALLDEVRTAAAIQAQWRALELEGDPRVARGGAAGFGSGTSEAGEPAVRALADAVAGASDRLTGLARLLQREGIGQALPADVTAWLSALAADAVTPMRVVSWHRTEAALAALVGPAFVRELKGSGLEPRRWPDLFLDAWRRSCLEAIHADHPALAAFDGRTHEQFVDEFRRLDRQRIELAAQRVRAEHADRVVAACNRFRDQEALVRAEAAKKRRHLPVRDLVARAPDVLTALFPCWLASPLSVSQLLPARTLFDVVLFDEASQVLPEDAVPALFRAPQAVIAGDRRQLPPTTFFAAMEDGDEHAEEAVSGFDSILENLSAFLVPEWYLDWHYRSRDEALIAFSNHHIYRGRLVTFPGPGGVPALVHELVDDAGGGDAGEESVAAEVRRVVSLVAAHAETRPHESLGVIAMGIVHARRVELAVDQLRQQRPELAPFFDEQRTERFFVKNLERVQGDERDAIILSVGYGKDRSGRLPFRFGPLLQEGGERRLNVAVTRARVRVTLVSSFSHYDMDPAKCTSEGVRLLRAYLEYAASGGRSLGRDGITGEPLNAFEQHVFDALQRRGVRLVPQYGASRFRIDMVAQHPGRPGRLVLAIECDGASYHAAPTARDRDRLRQQHLEALGWRFHRIWSTDWFLRPDEEIERALAAYRDAVAHADRVDAGATIAPLPEVAGPRRVPALPAPPSWPRDESRTPPAASAGPRPSIAPGLPIEKYSDEQLRQMAVWVLGGNPWATDAELLPLLMTELGFGRRGSRIVARLEAAIREARVARRG